MYGFEKSVRTIIDPRGTKARKENEGTERRITDTVITIIWTK